MTQEATLIPGWYGKIPALGDFASRRLPSEFITVWDAWLQHGMAASRANLGERWLDIYLTSPIWRFALLPGVIGQQAWSGLMMPSVDKVGRHFPLTLALPLRGELENLTAMLVAQKWYADMETVALAALNIDFSADQLESELLALAPPPAHREPLDEAAERLAGWWDGPGSAFTTTLPESTSPGDLLSASAQYLFCTVGRGKTLWWSNVGAPARTQFRAFSGLPPDDQFGELLTATSAGEINIGIPV